MGGVLAAAGSAIGLGNLWRFPTEAGQNGGSAFLFVYFICVLIFGIPLLIAEFCIGRRARCNVGDAFKVLAPDSPWRHLGLVPVVIAFLILCYYNVIAGWVLCYAYDAAAGHFQVSTLTDAEGRNVFANGFSAFISDPWQPVLCLTIFMGLTWFIITRGVQRGIERSSRFLMPLLFVIMILLMVFALRMPGAGQGLSFLFTPDFSAITPKVVLSALAQCFYSLSLGMGLITYASYFTRENHLGRSALSVGVMDTLVAVCAGIVIFPAVFSVPDIEPSSGASLVFIALPNVFNSALGGMPVLAWLIPLLFYVLLLVATLTSCMFLHEVVTAFVAETFAQSRRRAALEVSVACIAIGIVCSLGNGPWADVQPFGMGIIDFFDYVTAKLMLPISGLLVALFVGYKLSRWALLRELSSYGMYRVNWYKVLLFDLRVLVPLIIVIIMVTQLTGFI